MRFDDAALVAVGNGERDGDAADEGVDIVRALIAEIGRDIGPLLGVRQGEGGASGFHARPL